MRVCCQTASQSFQPFCRACGRDQHTDHATSRCVYQHPTSSISCSAGYAANIWKSLGVAVAAAELAGCQSTSVISLGPWRNTRVLYISWWQAVIVWLCYIAHSNCSLNFCSALFVSKTATISWKLLWLLIRCPVIGLCTVLGSSILMTCCNFCHCWGHAVYNTTQWACCYHRVCYSRAIWAGNNIHHHHVE